MLSTIKHILIPLDFTERNDSVLEAAAELATNTGASLTLIHVVEPMGDKDDAELQAFTNRLVSEADDHLKVRADRLAGNAINVRCENRVGKRNAEIVAFAIDQQVDLIVMNSHKVTLEDADRTAFSLSHQVALLAPCAILMLKS